MRKVHELLREPKNAVTAAILAGTAGMVAFMLVPTEETFQFDKNNPATVVGLQEITKTEDDFYIGGANMSRQINPFVSLEQCDVVRPNFCTTVNLPLPEDYIIGTIAIGDTVIASSDL